MSRAPRWTRQRELERDRNRTLAERLLRVTELNYMTRMCHAAAVRLANPGATARDIHRAWLLHTLGERLIDEIEAAGHDLYRGIPDDPIIVERRADERRVAEPSESLPPRGEDGGGPRLVGRPRD